MRHGEGPADSHQFSLSRLVTNHNKDEHQLNGSGQWQWSITPSDVHDAFPICGDCLVRIRGRSENTSIFIRRLELLDLCFCGTMSIGKFGGCLGRGFPLRMDPI